MKRFERLRALPCCQCQAPAPSQVAHANWGGGFFKDGGKGMGKKADDEYTIPLCHKCHKKLDGYWEMSRDRAKDWFLDKLYFVNKALGEPAEPIF